MAEFLAKILVGIFLVYVSLTALVAALQNPQIQNNLIGLAVVFGLLWWLWSELPEWFRKLVRRSLKRKEQRHER